MDFSSTFLILNMVELASLMFSLAKTNLSEVSTKLASTNYLLRKAQVVPILRGHGILGYVKNEVRCPPATTVSEDGTVPPTQQHLIIGCTDQLILGWLNSSLSNAPLS